MDTAYACVCLCTMAICVVYVYNIFIPLHDNPVHMHVSTYDDYCIVIKCMLPFMNTSKCRLTVRKNSCDREMHVARTNQSNTVFTCCACYIALTKVDKVYTTVFNVYIRRQTGGRECPAARHSCTVSGRWKTGNRGVGVVSSYTL